MSSRRILLAGLLASTMRLSSAASTFRIAAANTVTELQKGHILGVHTDPGFQHQPQTILPNLIVGEAFQVMRALKPGWANYSEGGVLGSAVLDAGERFAAANKPSMRLTFTSGAPGQGVVGLTHRGLGFEGLFLRANASYQGYVFAKAATPQLLHITLRNYVTRSELASTAVTVPAGNVWTQLHFSLNTSSGTTCDGIAPGSDPNIDCDAGKVADYVCIRCGGEATFTLSAPGSVNLGMVVLEPGTWGQVNGILKSTSDLLAQLGVGLVRYGGAVNRNIDWSDWRGPKWNRTSLGVVWDGDGPSWGGSADYSSWGLFDALDAFTPLGIDVVFTVSEAATPQHLADLVEYAYGDGSTEFGSLRIADGHPAPYVFHGIEVGNEQYNSNWVAQIAAVEQRMAELGRGNSTYYIFPTNEGLNAADQQRAIAAGLPISRVAADIHVGAGGGVEAAVANFKASPSFGDAAFCGEVNAETSAMDRALTEAADINDWLNAPPEVLSRLVGRTASFLTERNGHWDGSPWHQGLTFYLPNMTWLGPAGQVHTMLTQTWASGALAVSPTTNGALSVSAQKDATHLVVRVSNSDSKPSDIVLDISGMATNPDVVVWTLQGTSMNETNTPANPFAIAPVQSNATIPSGGGLASVPALSYTIYVFSVVAEV